MDRPAQRLALIEIAERDARGVRLVDVFAWPVGMGRSMANTVVLDDPHVAPEHARIDLDEQGRPALTVLDEVNGLTHGAQRLPAGAAWLLPAEGATLHLGTTRLRIRLPAERLAPAQPLSGRVPIRAAAVAACGVALLVLQLAEQWLALDPGADLAIWLPLLLGLPVGVAAWCGVWALLSKLFQHRFDFSGHLRIALPWLLALAGVEAVWPQLGASSGQAWLWQLGPPLQALLGLLLVRAHLLHLLPMHPRTVTGALTTLALVGAGLSVAFTLRSSDSLSSAPYMSTLPLPAARLGGTVSTEQAVQAMGPLADQVARRAQKARTNEDEESAESTESGTE